MYISRIYLKHIRGFRELELNLLEDHSVRGRIRRSRQRSVIIGRNGTCKTTLLRCIAIGLSDEKDASGLVSEPIGQLVSDGLKNGTIEIDLVGSRAEPRSAKIITSLSTELDQNVVVGQETKIDGRRASRKSFNEKVRRNLFVCGYGAGRSSEGSEPVRAYRIIDSVYSLFNYDQSLTNVELTLRRLEDYIGTKHYEKTLDGISRVLRLSKKHRIRLPKGGGVMIHGPDLGHGVPLQGWADGYRVTFTWLLDLYAWAMRAKRITRSGKINGILLVDELEHHLHPAMQADLLHGLSFLLPDLQTVISTHSPLVALGVEPAELVVFKRMGNQVKLETEVPNTEGYSAEDLLVDSRIFDVPEVYTAETRKKLKDFRHLSSIAPKERNTSQEKRLNALAEELYAYETPNFKKDDLDRKFDRLLKKYLD